MERSKEETSKNFVNERNKELTCFRQIYQDSNKGFNPIWDVPF